MVASARSRAAARYHVTVQVGFAFATDPTFLWEFRIAVPDDVELALTSFFLAMEAIDRWIAGITVRLAFVVVKVDFVSEERVKASATHDRLHARRRSTCGADVLAAPIAASGIFSGRAMFAPCRGRRLRRFI